MSEHVPLHTAGQLRAAGFNAFGQLNPDHTKDLRSFELIYEAQDPAAIRVLFTCWSSTVLLVDSRLVAHGFQRFELELEPHVAGGLRDGFGDHNGMIGCLDTAGRLYLLHDDGDARCGPLDCPNGPTSPRISHLALAVNGRVAIVMEKKLTSTISTVVEFDTFDDLLQWFQDPIANIDEFQQRSFDAIGHPKQLLANLATFLLLMDDGKVYSWGDPRYQSLGRSIYGEGGLPADTPAVLESLEGLKIVKIACGGWTGAALSEDRALYIWGTALPGGEDPTVKPMREAGAGDVVLVEIALPNGEPMDVVDVGVGDNHIVLIGERGDIWGVGSNRNGQLGLGDGERFVDDWELIRPAGQFLSLACGPKATWLFSTG